MPQLEMVLMHVQTMMDGSEPRVAQLEAEIQQHMADFAGPNLEAIEAWRARGQALLQRANDLRSSEAFRVPRSGDTLLNSNAFRGHLT